MMLADKIIRLRKKNGWSQEELADRLEVSRQAVAKWEGAQSVPTIEKLLQLSDLFGVSTDYLLKDGIEQEEFPGPVIDMGIRRVTMAEANEYLTRQKTASVQMAIGTFLCVIAVIPLLILGAAAEYLSCGITEVFAGAVGVGTLLAVIAIAVGLFVSYGLRNQPYEFLEKEPFELEYGVSTMVREKQKAFQNTHTRHNIIGTCLCVISPIPLIASAVLKNEFLVALMMPVLLLLVGVGVLLFVTAGVRWGSMQKLLQEGEYTVREKKKSGVKGAVAGIYWTAVTAIYLGWSLPTDRWDRTWIVWPVAGVLFACVMGICNIILSKKE